MILVSQSGVKFVIRDDKATYSPYLEGAILISGDDCRIHLDHLSTHALQEYVSFLNGGIPTMDGEVERAFDFMGHPNVLKYPHDYWAIKLHHRWVQDHPSVMVGFHGMKTIPFCNDTTTLDTITCLEGIYIYGSNALLLAGVTSSYTDPILCHDRSVNVAATSIDTMMQFLKLQHIENVCVHDNHATCRVPIGRWGLTFQINLRIFDSPSQIAFDADLDCGGMVISFQEGAYRLWATDMAIWSMNNRINYLDPEMMHPGYIRRMIKYLTEGIRPVLPLLPDVSDTKVQECIQRIQEAYDRIPRSSGMPNYNYDPDVEVIPGVRGCYRLSYTNRHTNPDEQLMIIIDNMWTNISRGTMTRDAFQWLVPLDEASTIMLALRANITIYMWRNKDIVREYIDHCIEDIPWTTNNTHTLTPIRGIKAWYAKSPLIQNVSYEC